MIPRFTLLIVLSLALVKLLIGCTPLQEREKHLEVLAGRATVVLLRVTVGWRIKAFGSSILTPHIKIGIGNFETRGEIKQKSPTFLSAHSRKQGWAIFILEPTTHYLRLPIVGNSGPDLMWRIEIPRGSRVAYIGSLHLECTTMKERYVHPRYLHQCFRTGMRAYYGDAVLRNEEDLAKEVAAKHLADLGPLQTSLMQRYIGPIIIRTPK